MTTTVDDCIILRLGGFDDDDITLNNPGLSGHVTITMDTSGGTVTAMYWADENVQKIQRGDIDGSNIEDLVTGITKPRALALDVAGGKMYWADEEVDKIQRANLDGSNIEDLITGITKPRALALDIAGGKMYWADEEVQKIQRANLDGSNIEDLITGIVKPKALALALNEAGSGEPISGGAGYVKRSAAGDSGTSEFALTASQQSQMLTIAIVPAPGSGGGCGGTISP